jgi:hypothetical protein
MRDVRELQDKITQIDHLRHPQRENSDFHTAAADSSRSTWRSDRDRKMSLKFRLTDISVPYIFRPRNGRDSPGYRPLSQRIPDAI